MIDDDKYNPLVLMNLYTVRVLNLELCIPFNYNFRSWHVSVMRVRVYVCKNCVHGYEEVR